MADFRVRRVEHCPTKLKNVPIAVTPEGFWCCPSLVVFQKTLKRQQSSQNRHKPPPQSQKPSPVMAQKHLQETKQGPTQSRSRAAYDDRRLKTKVENSQRKVAVEFGDPMTSDLKLVLYGKRGFCVQMNVHRHVIVECSSFFADKLSQQSPVSCLEIGECEDVEIYIETLGLMYCKDIKLRLIKQSVMHVLRILKIAESIGFDICTKLCLEYLEAVPWVDEDEEKVVSSIQRLRSNRNGVSPVLKRVIPDNSNPPNDTLAHIMQLILKSNEDRGRREMKSLVSKLLQENNLTYDAASNICNENIYDSCRSCLDSMLVLFRQAAESRSTEKSMDGKGSMARQVALEADNLLWLVEILYGQQAADEFVAMWTTQHELATLHSKLAIVDRHPVSCITARLLVGIGRGEVLPSKDTRKLLLETWLQPLISDYSWLQHGCRSFDGKMVEDGIGRTILTLPMEDQQSILLAWLGNFLKVGDNCPNLRRAFEVWWRRTFIRPYIESDNLLQSENAVPVGE
ncbi:BTB/POZ domain-containing protein At3g50780-like [Magnolia sinica]|uniref:BTB/POZ domain-containing protein At3g50780-like n=1 Tax=Magnolia sinica TaxID=86752 RepID=UPI00265B5215|nr:BTB/POZ domain-containing protein At3g50780-like [Magnolia sinica]